MKNLTQQRLKWLSMYNHLFYKITPNDEEVYEYHLTHPHICGCCKYVGSKLHFVASGAITPRFDKSIITNDGPAVACIQDQDIFHVNVKYLGGFPSGVCCIDTFWGEPAFLIQAYVSDYTSPQLTDFCSNTKFVGDVLPDGIFAIAKNTGARYRSHKIKNPRSRASKSQHASFVNCLRIFINSWGFRGIRPSALSTRKEICYDTFPRYSHN